jgi:hypothetical protein
MTAGDGATVAFAIGAAALVAGGVVWFTAPKEPRADAPAASAAPRVVVAPTLGGALVRATF